MERAYELMLEQVKPDVLKHGFQAVFIKDWDGCRGKSWLLSNCASDCGVSPGCWKCPVVLLEQKRLMELKRAGLPAKRVPAKFLRENLLDPKYWTKRHMVFTCPEGDLFKNDIEDFNIAEVFAVMEHFKQHVFIVLTKRFDRMRHLLTSVWFTRQVQSAGWKLFGDSFNFNEKTWGSNLLVGVSVEDQLRMERAEIFPDLPKQMGKVMFTSPLLEHLTIPPEVLRHLDWVVCNRERGSTYCDPRPCDIEWIKSLKDQCDSAKVPFFLEDRHTKKLLGALFGVPRDYPPILAR